MTWYISRDFAIRGLRWTIALVFLWFGFQQLIQPSAWVDFLPVWTGYIPMPAEMLIRLNGWVEVLCGVLLAFGAFTRVVAGVLGLHLLGIAVSVSGAIGVRDGALAVCALIVAGSLPDDMTTDVRFLSSSDVSARLDG